MARSAEITGSSASPGAGSSAPISVAETSLDYVLDLEIVEQVATPVKESNHVK
jgi:hypothetical protein